MQYRATLPRKLLSMLKQSLMRLLAMIMLKMASTESMRKLLTVCRGMLPFFSISVSFR